MKNKILYLEMAKQFGLLDKKGKLPRIGDITSNGYKIKFGVYKKEVLDYYDTYFDGCGFYLEQIEDNRIIEGLGGNSKDLIFLTPKEYESMLEKENENRIWEKEREIKKLKSEINNLK